MSNSPLVDVEYCLRRTQTPINLGSDNKNDEMIVKSKNTIIILKQIT